MICFLTFRHCLHASEQCLITVRTEGFLSVLIERQWLQCLPSECNVDWSVHYESVLPLTVHGAHSLGAPQTEFYKNACWLLTVLLMCLFFFCPVDVTAVISSIIMLDPQGIKQSSSAVWRLWKVNSRSGAWHLPKPWQFKRPRQEDWDLRLSCT